MKGGGIFRGVCVTAIAFAAHRFIVRGRIPLRQTGGGPARWRRAVKPPVPCYHLSERSGECGAMRMKWIRFCLAIAVPALLLSCGGGRKPPSLSSDWRTGVLARHSPVPPLSPTTNNEQPTSAVAEALAELDSLPTPEGVDASLFSQLKSALRDALVHGVGARHAVPLREEEALLEAVGRGPVPRRETDVEAGRRPTGGRPTEPGSAAFPGGDSPTTNNQQLTTRRMASKPPTGEANRVDDLALIDNGDGTYTHLVVSQCGRLQPRRHRQYHGHHAPCSALQRICR